MTWGIQITKIGLRGKVGVRPFWVGMGGKLNLNVMEVGGIYGEKEVDVNGAWGNWEEELR